MQNLGKKAKDKITGFEGIIIGKIIYLFGCHQYGIAPQGYDKEKGTRFETQWFDEGRIEIIGDGITAEEVKSKSGDGPDFNFDSPKGVQ